MNRFEYVEARLHENETFVNRDRSVKLYDGDDKTHFEDGEVVLTSHRLFWGRPGEIAKGAVTLCLSLQYVLSVGEESASSYVFGRKTRLILHLRPPSPQKAPGPLDTSRAGHIKLSGKNGLKAEFSVSLKETIEARIWEVIIISPTRELSLSSPSAAAAARSAENSVALSAAARLGKRTGIGGIERALEDKGKETDENIALAFQDLNVLMAMAKEMVNISKSISSKIRDQKGDISDDETVRFKSYLMSLGIDDPVTREGFTSNTAYYRSLAQQLCEMLLDPLEECGGMMSLADVYCRVNRARGLELLSPEDLLNACHQLDDGPIKLRKFPSGAMVLQLENQDDTLVAEETLQQIEDSAPGWLAAEDLAQLLSISLLLAKERLLAAERLGKVCRDESVEGLRFYPNWFLTRADE